MFLLVQLPKDVLFPQLSNGLLLLVLGMGIVFLFLTILVFVTKTMSGLLGKIKSKEIVSPVQTSDSSEAEIAVVLAAANAKLKN